MSDRIMCYLSEKHMEPIRKWNRNYKLTNELWKVPGVPLGILGAGVALGAEVTCGPNVQHT